MSSPEIKLMVPLLSSQEPCWVETSTVLMAPAPVPWVSGAAFHRVAGEEMAVPEQDASEDF